MSKADEGAADGAIRRKIGRARSKRPVLRNQKFVSDLFARLLEERLKSAFSGPFVISVTLGEVASLTDALGKAGEIALCGAAKTSAGAFGGAVTLSARTVHLLICAMTGAPISASAASREPTAIDEALVSGVTADIIDCFDKAAAEAPRAAEKPALSFRSFTRKTSSLTGAPEKTDVQSFTITITPVNEDGAEAEEAPELSLIIPLTVLDIYRAKRPESPARPELSGPGSPEAVWADAMLAAARMAEFRLIGVLHETMMTVEALQDLSVGSVIPLPFDGRMNVSLRLDSGEGVAGAAELAAGALGAADVQRAVKIETPPDERLLEELRYYDSGGLA